MVSVLQTLLDEMIQLFMDVFARRNDKRITAEMTIRARQFEQSLRFERDGSRTTVYPHEFSLERQN